ncbi:MAG TPA: hypothetical protein PKE06_09375 [Flavilitoribacter sp.]|nr:hypothetical protein [Flavilitoribacter sp.]HMQ88236.1 hypothetical protein [Flavilitoribacter sp.]
MALHDTPASMLKESLVETLIAAKFCANFDKTKSDEFPNGNGCLGYPSAILLFSIVDSIGSYLRGDKFFLIDLDGKKTYIKDDGWEHFKVLNSSFFEQNLSEQILKYIYQKARSFLVHNAILGKDVILMPNNDKLPKENDTQVFFIQQADTGEKIWISIRELHKLCEDAVSKFKDKIDNIVPNSRQGKNFK